MLGSRGLADLRQSRRSRRQPAWRLYTLGLPEYHLGGVKSRLGRRHDRIDFMSDVLEPET